MYRINHNVYSHLRLALAEDIYTFDSSKISGKKGEIITDQRFASIAEIRRSEGYPVDSFNKLVKLVAELGFRNKSFNLLFRGQDNDYKNRKKMTNLYPSIFRPDEGKKLLRKVILKKRFADLLEAIKILRKEREQINSHKGLSSYREYQMALIQHYKIMDTPLLDLTHSLHVAASFALLKSKEGYVYVLGMPHTNGSISLFVDQSIRIVKLQNVCPPEAVRPHFQNGYLVGRLTFTQSKEAGDNFASRLIGKYKLRNIKGKFWGSVFAPISENMLLPKKDPFQRILNNLLNN